MDDSILMLFGPDEANKEGNASLKAVSKQKNKDAKNKRFLQEDHHDLQPMGLHETIIKRDEEKEMDTLLGLFDPSLEDETTSTIDDLNSSSTCLTSCYKKTTKCNTLKKSKKNKRQSSPDGSMIQQNKLNNANNNKQNTSSNADDNNNDEGSSMVTVENKVVETALNNSSSCITDTVKRKTTSVNMLDRYNDWATQKLSNPRNTFINNNKAANKNTNATNANRTSINSKINNNNTNINNNGNNRKASKRKNKNSNVSGKYIAPALVNTSKELNEDKRINILTDISKDTPLKCSNINNITENVGSVCSLSLDKLIKVCNVTKKLENFNLDEFNKNVMSADFKNCNISNNANENNNNSSSSNEGNTKARVLQSYNFPRCDLVDVEEEMLPDQLPSEPQEGNIEYKLKLLNPNQERFKRLVSQMQWRLREGLGEAIYEIGVEDSGLLLGLTHEELALSMATLRRMARQLGASLTIIREKSIGDGIRKVAEVLVRKVPDDQYSIELRIAVLGSSDVGKSTLLGVLTRGELDNGRGCARLNVFRHRHEVYSGKTSSISIQTMGFDSHGNVVDGTCTRSRDYDDEDICSQSSKICNFIDLAGDQRYLHTTAFGLSGYCPHYAMLVVSAFCGLSAMAEEHLSLARAVDLPLLLVVTKTDLATPQQLQHTLSTLKTSLTAPPYKKVPLVVETADDAITAGSSSTGQQEGHGSVVPIFLVSSVTGDGLDLLKKFLFVLPPKMTTKEREMSEQEVVQFQVDEVFHVDERVVVGGLLTAGVIPHGTTLMLGPFDDCDFHAVSVESIHRNKVPCRVVCAGQSASLCLSGLDNPNIRKGMKLLAPETKPKAAYYFQARIRVMSGECGVGKGCELTAHIGNVRQTVVVAGVLGKDRVRTSDPQASSVLLRFLRQPEYISVGARLLLRQGGVKGVGQLQQVFGERAHTVLKAR